LAFCGVHKAVFSAKFGILYEKSGDGMGGGEGPFDAYKLSGNSYHPPIVSLIIEKKT